MKRIISVLVFVAMMFTTMAAIIPAFAAEAASEPLNTYSVNWKKLLDSGAMRAQWVYDRGADQNNYEKKYKVTATETELTSEQKGEGDTRLYYSDVMFDITADTYYVYELEVQNLDYSDAGVIFAFAADPNAYNGGDRPVVGAAGDADPTVPKSAYFIQGNFDEGKDIKVHFGGPYQDDGDDHTVFGTGSKTALANIKVVDGYVKLKVVYNGLTVKMYYVNTNNEYVEFFADKTMTLVAGSKVTFGVSTWKPDWVNIKNCVVTAYNDAASKNMEKGYLDFLIKKADLSIAGNTVYTPKTKADLESALAVAKTVAGNATATADDIRTVKTELDTALAALKVAANKTELQKAITDANAKLEGKTATDFVERYYTAFIAAIDAAVVVNNDAEAVQEDADNACKGIADAAKYLTPAGQACKVDIVELLAAYSKLVEKEYTSDSWAALAAPYAAVTALNANTELTADDQSDIDQATKALSDAIKALVKRADVRKLQIAIERTEALDKTDYKNWNIDTVLADAKTVAANNNADQATVDAALKALEDAVDALIAYRANVLLIDVEGYNHPSKEAEHYEKITDKAYFGEGNVFYYDYHKFVSSIGHTSGTRFTQTLGEGGYNKQGSSDIVLRLGTNVSGSGTNRVTDGDKSSKGTPLSHKASPMLVNGKKYDHVFGFSFLKAPTVDSIAFYLPTNTKIASIDIYGAVRGTAADGSVLYGKADADDVVSVDGVQDESSTTATKIYLGTVNVPAAKDGADNIWASGDFVQACAVEYIYFAITFKEGSSWYDMYEVELYGLEDGQGAANFKALNKAYVEYMSCVQSDYTAASWEVLMNAVNTHAAVISNCLSAQADVDKATAALNAALEALVANATDKADLKAAIDLAKGFSESAYTPNSWKILADALKVAQEAFESSKSVQTAIDNATKTLNDAVAKLAKRGDKTELKKAIDTAKKYKEENYKANLTAWKMFANALKKAEGIYADDNATQNDVDNIKADLVLKQADLVPVEGYVPEEETEEGGATEEATESATQETEPKETEKKGGCGSSVALSALAVVGVVGTAVILKKKED